MPPARALGREQGSASDHGKHDAADGGLDLLFTRFVEGHPIDRRQARLRRFASSYTRLETDFRDRSLARHTRPFPGPHKLVEYAQSKPTQAEAAATPEPTPDEPEPKAAAKAEPVAEIEGTIDGAPFAVHGVLAHRRRATDPQLEIRLFDRAVSCTSFDADYESRPGEPLAIINLGWPKAIGDCVSFGAATLEDRLQFCTGKEGSGRASCEPRAQTQGSLTVLEASPTSGAATLEIDSPNGSLTGRLEFTLCPDAP